MTSDTITINKNELYNLVRKAISDELNQMEEISDSEQKEIEKIHGKLNTNSQKNNFDECIEL